MANEKKDDGGAALPGGCAMSLPSKYMALAGHIRPKPTEATIAIERCTLSDSEGGIEGSERDIEVDVTGRVEYDAGRDEFEARLLTAT